MCDIGTFSEFNLTLKQNLDLERVWTSQLFSEMLIDSRYIDI